MKAEVGRRVFVGTAVAGLPLLAGFGSGAFAQSHEGGAHDLVQTAMDEELRRQIRDAVSGLQGRHAAESARRMAATLRMGAAHYATIEADEGFKQAVRAFVRKEGRQALLARVTDRTQLSADLREYGVRSLPASIATDSGRAEIVDGMLQSGFTPTLLALAQQFNDLATRLEREPGVVHVSAAAACPDISAYRDIVEVAIMMTCLWNPPACAIFTGMYAGWLAAYYGVTYFFGGC
jgi:hypothetical protein